jgi:hypothetical protein
VTGSLAEQAEDFANDLTATVCAVVGAECPAFYPVALEEADAFTVRQGPLTESSCAARTDRFYG